VRRRKYQFDEAKVQKYVAEGRGSGDGAYYNPWLKITDLPSRGRSHRVFGIKTGRVHHLLSDGEWKCFLRFEADPTVVDIREQLPLDRLQTYAIARELGYRPPITTDGTPYVLTIDFLITRRMGDSFQLEPYSFKYKTEKLTDRQHQLHRIAEECTRRNGLTLKRLDESFFDERLIRNYDAIRSFFDISSHADYEPSKLRRQSSALLDVVANPGNHTLGSACREVAKACDTTPQAVLRTAKHLLARGVLVSDHLSKSADLPDMELTDIRIGRKDPPTW